MLARHHWLVVPPPIHPHTLDSDNLVDNLHTRLPHMPCVGPVAWFCFRSRFMILKSVLKRRLGIFEKKKKSNKIKNTTTKKLRLCAIYLPRSSLLQKTRKETLQFQQALRKTRKKMLVWKTSGMGWLHQDLNWVLAPSPGLIKIVSFHPNFLPQDLGLCTYVLMNTWRKELVVLHDFFNTDAGFSQSFQNGRNFPPKLWTL